MNVLVAMHQGQESRSWDKFSVTEASQSYFGFTQAESRAQEVSVSIYGVAHSPVQSTSGNVYVDFLREVT